MAAPLPISDKPGRHQDAGIADISALQTRIGYTFRDVALLNTALTHPSWLVHAPTTASYQRLEFLGDSVLGLVLAEALYQQFTDKSEGFLTQALAVLAKGRFLAGLSQQLHIPEHLRVSEQARSDQLTAQSNAAEDALEALVGAIYLDSDFPTVRNVVLAWYGDMAADIEVATAQANPKGRLQEWFQQHHSNTIPAYELIDTTGPSHCPEFTVAVSFDGEQLGTGTGPSKKAAEEQAAMEALKHIQHAQS